MGDRFSFSPLMVTWRAAKSTTISPMVTCSPSDAAGTLAAVRFKTADTRIISSRGEKGLTT